MNSRTLATILTVSALSLVACSTDTNQPTTAETHCDWAAHIQAIAKASGEKAFAEIDVVGPMVTLTYLDGQTVMNGGGNEAGRFEYRTYDDFQDTRSFKPLAQVPIAEFATALGEQEKKCGDKQVTGRITITATGAVLQRLGCESTTMKLDVASTSLEGKALPTFDSLLAKPALTAVVAEARQMHGDKLASITLQPAAEGDTAKAVVTAAPRPNAGGSAQCAQVSTRWARPGTKGLLANYADCADVDNASSTLNAAGLDADKLLTGISKVATDLGVKPEALTTVSVLPGKTPTSVTVQAEASGKKATVEA